MHIAEQFTFSFDKNYLPGDEIVINGHTKPLRIEKVLFDRLMVKDCQTQEVYLVMLSDCRRATDLDYL
jgi:hypothetical protein